MRLGNKSNPYSEALGDLFDKAPKSVLAAVAVSALTCGGDQIEQARERVLKEWGILKMNGIIDQKPPKS